MNAPRPKSAPNALRPRGRGGRAFPPGGIAGGEGSRAPC